MALENSRKYLICKGCSGDQSYTLTTGVDNITSTGSNDVINGFSATGANAATDTLTVVDTINGGAGIDTLNVSYTGATADATAGALISNVEVFNIRNTAAATAVNLDASKIAGLTNINAYLSAGQVNITKAASGSTIGVVGNGTLANGNVTFTESAVTNAINLSFDGGTKLVASTGGAGFGVVNAIATATTATTATISSTGAANSTGQVVLTGGAGGVANTITGLTKTTATIGTLTVNAASNLTSTLTTEDFTATSALTVSGAAASVSIAFADNTGTLATNSAASADPFKTIDASGLTTGGLSITLGTTTTSFKGGAGNDVVTTAATTAAAASIDAGAGTADVLNLAAANDVTTAAKAALYTNFDILRNSTATNVDTSLFTGITSLQANATGAGFVKMTAAQAAAITVRTTDAGATFALADASGTSDVLTVTLNNSTATTGPTLLADLTTVTVNGFETMNVVSSSGQTAATLSVSTLSFTSATSLTSLKLSGAAPLILATANISKTVTIDASGMTHTPATSQFALTESGVLIKGSVLNATNQADSLTTGTVVGSTGDFVTYNAAAGNDTVVTTLVDLNNTSAAAGSVKIDGGAGTDTLSITAATFADPNFQYVTNMEKITITGGGVSSITTGGFFDTNFKTAGVTFTNAAADANTTIDATSFTGAATMTITQTGAGAVGDVYTLKSGSGNDTITLKTALAITATTGLINSGDGNDTVSIDATAVAWAAAGGIAINLGNGIDIFNGSLGATSGAGKLVITGGAGADTFNLTAHAVGNLMFNQGVADSGTFVKPSANTISTTAFDVVNGAAVGDKFTLTANATPGAVVQATDLSAVVLGNDTITEVRGTYSAASGTFIGSVGGADEMFIFDTSTGATVTYEAVVVVGVGAVAGAAGGVVTL